MSINQITNLPWNAPASDVDQAVRNNLAKKGVLVRDEVVTPTTHGPAFLVTTPRNLRPDYSQDTPAPQAQTSDNTTDAPQTAVSTDPAMSEAIRSYLSVAQMYLQPTWLEEGAEK